MNNIPLSQPDITEEDIAAVTAVLRSGRLSLGPKLEEFETAFASFVGVKHAIAVSSGTAALHVCVRALNIGEGDEVITTPFSFIASSNCILFERARPVFVDVLPSTLCIDPALVEKAITPKTKAIVAVDILGYLAEWEKLQAIAKKHNLALIEDSCEALGSAKGTQQAGTFADCGTFAFYPNKQMTAGEGGMITTNRDEIADLARSLRNQGRGGDQRFLHHVRLGYNYRISDINCALGLSQLKRLPDLIAHRRQVAAWYAEELAPHAANIMPPPAQTGVNVSWFVYTARLAERYTRKQRDQLLAFLRGNGIGCNDYFPAIHLQPFYREMGWKEGDFPVAEAASDRSVALPFSSQISRDEVKTVCKILGEGLSQLRS